MATSKKPRKKHNKNERLIKFADKQADRTFALFIHGLGDEGIEWVLNDKPVYKNRAGRYTSTAFVNLFTLPRQWGLTLGTVCRAPNGDTYLSYDFVRTRNQLCFPDLDDFISQELHNQMGKVNNDHVLSTFFVASPEGYEFSDDDLGRLMRWKNVYRLKTRYETDNLYQRAMKELAGIDLSQYLDKQLINILNKNNITNFSDIRKQGLETVSTFKGVAEKRCEQIINAFKRIVTERKSDIPSYIQYEICIGDRIKALNYFEKHNNHVEMIS